MGFKIQKHKTSLNMKIYLFACRLTEGEAMMKPRRERLMDNVRIKEIKQASCSELFERKGISQSTDLGVV